ncbi:MAG: pyridoxamine 5'-phosphate oxidase [Desulfobacteraceae bacterium IS3]|nr:MAG: pyridoxamine 5'-phosphate oxidase [Desulfobacteraceae bacterium IS3]
MIRKEREIKEKSEIESVILKAQICRIAMTDGEYPYIVPLCFGYEENALYFHSATIGKKLDLLNKNNKVCFELDADTEIKTAEKACKWGMKYKSVIGCGEAFFVEDIEQKRRALDIIMQHYSGSPPFEYPEAVLRKIAVIRIDIREMTGKQAVS